MLLDDVERAAEIIKYLLLVRVNCLEALVLRDGMRDIRESGN